MTAPTLTAEARARLDAVKSTDRYTDQDLRELAPHIVHCDPIDLGETPVDPARRPEIHLTPRGFDMLHDYTTSMPTGKCDGKVWKVQDWHWERHHRCRFGYGCPPNPNECVEHRQRPQRVMEGTWWLAEYVETDEFWHAVTRRIVVVE